MKRTVLSLGSIGANCYILSDENTNEAIIIDPGIFDVNLKQALEGLDVKYILLTHGHFDHIMGTNGVKSMFPNARVCIHAADEICLHDRKYNLLGDNYDGEVEDIKADMILNDGDSLSFSGGELTVLHTPGHSKGSVCFIDNENKAIYSGDTLFCLTVGRTDFIGGSFDEMMVSIGKLSLFDDAYEVFPGHNRSTTIGFERKRNRYMRML